MAKKHKVEVVEAFQIEIPVGPLVIQNLAGGAVDFVDGPRVRIFKYAKGEVLQFAKKADAMAFIAHHTPKVRLVE